MDRRFITRRSLLAGGGALALSGSSLPLIRPARAQATSDQSPFVVFQILYRGETDVERGFAEYLYQREIPVQIERRNADLDPSRVEAFVQEAKEMKPDLVYSWGTPVTIATFGKYADADPKTDITEIPGVFTLVTAPVASGIVPSFESSERNITGTSHVVPPAAQVRAMQSYRPFKVLGVLYTPNEQNSVTTVASLREVASEMDFKLVERQFALDAEGKPTAEGAGDLVGELAEEGAEWLYYLPDTFLGSNMDKVAPAATKHGIPGFSATELISKYALLSLVSRYYSLGQLTAYKAEQILVNKVPPRDIPIETLKRFSLIINMKYATDLKLYPPLAMLNYAEVIRG
ncbi:ABC transporter substrate-binding protein [Amorphus orientalis]|uniref:ABC transport system substrate-binding protein n=1 Tax=Amorphus orientalis TaxID=649198 RepID=A0AAE3VSV9_9HYPH|nr:ABC transporter substrate-binding protein [Amorphus orientalis]MDQ0317543.1 putative ABC transport system substrate-binding protein [Amorphus orientalis]